MVERRIDSTYRVRFDECAADGQLRSSALLRYAQDLAWIHSEQAGFGRDWYAGQRLTWLIRGVQLDVLDRPRYGTTLGVSSEVVGFRRAVARRRSEFNAGDGAGLVATALIDWILLDQRGVPARVPSELAGAFGGHEQAFTPLRARLPARPDLASTLKLHVRPSEIDPMGHVNNAVYVDYLEGHLQTLGGLRRALQVPYRYVVEFVGSARANDELCSAVWSDDTASHYRLESADGQDLVRARVETDLAAWVGG